MEPCVAIKASPSTAAYSHCIVDVSARLSELQGLILSTASEGPVTKETALSWAAAIDEVRSLMPPSGVLPEGTPLENGHTGASPTLSAAAQRVSPRKYPSHFHIADRGQMEERHVVPKVSSTDLTTTRNLSLCILSVLESLMSATHVDAISLVVPHRGMLDELRCLCRLSRGSERLFGGSGLVRGTNTLECSCLRTGLVLNMGPKALLAENEKGGECASFLELLQEGRHNARDTAASPSLPARTSCARLCCPIRHSPSVTAVGVLTATSSTRRFDSGDENLFFDGATVIASLLARCTDYSVLQASFSRGGLFQLLPQTTVSRDNGMLETRSQLVYRVDFDPSRGPQSLRIPSDNAGTIKLREGTPVECVFSHLERLQKSWLSAVKLNVELKRICDEKEEYISALVSRSRAERIGAKAPTTR